MVFQVDLKRQPAVADLIADMQPGDRVSFITSIKSKSPSLAEFTLEKAEEAPPQAADDNTDEGAGDEAEAPVTDASQNTPGGSVMQDRMAAASTAQI